MTNPVEAKLYTLRTTDRAGNSAYYADLVWPMVIFYVLRAQGKDLVLDLFGEDHDYDWDGLTDEERAAFQELL